MVFVIYVLILMGWFVFNEEWMWDFDVFIKVRVYLIELIDCFFGVLRIVFLVEIGYVQVYVVVKGWEVYCIVNFFYL